MTSFAGALFLASGDAVKSWQASRTRALAMPPLLRPTRVMRRASKQTKILNSSVNKTASCNRGDRLSSGNPTTFSVTGTSTLGQWPDGNLVDFAGRSQATDSGSCTVAISCRRYVKTIVGFLLERCVPRLCASRKYGAISNAFLEGWIFLFGFRFRV